MTQRHFLQFYNSKHYHTELKSLPWLLLDIALSSGLVIFWEEIWNETVVLATPAMVSRTRSIGPIDGFSETWAVYFKWSYALKRRLCYENLRASMTGSSEVAAGNSRQEDHVGNSLVDLQWLIIKGQYIWTKVSIKRHLKKNPLNLSIGQFIPEEENSSSKCCPPVRSSYQQILA